MSEKLAATIAAVADNFRRETASAQRTFVSSSRLGEGFRSAVSIRDHALTVDEPHGIGGSDAGPTPVELVLAALGTCQEITYRAFATALGIPLDSVAVTVEGDIDFRGFFAIDEAIRPGFQRLRVKVALGSSASQARIDQLVSAVNSHCPVLDMLSAPVPSSIEVKRV